MRSYKNHFKVQDEYPTPKMLVEPLEFYLDCFRSILGRKPVILCPFDTDKSWFVRLFQEWGFEVKYGHKETGQDFFTYDYGDYDIVISNPPFSIKYKVFEKLFNDGKPFCLLCNLMCINYQEIGNLFYKNSYVPVQLIVPDKKVSFNGKTSSFCCGYITWRFTNNTKWIHLEDNNTGKKFRDDNHLGLGVVEDVGLLKNE